MRFARVYLPVAPFNTSSRGGSRPKMLLSDPLGDLTTGSSFERQVLRGCGTVGPMTKRDRLISGSSNNTILFRSALLEGQNGSRFERRITNRVALVPNVRLSPFRLAEIR